MYYSNNLNNINGLSCGGDNIYVNVAFNNAPFQIRPTVANYNVTKTQPIVPKASDYYVSAIRFDIPTDDVPIFIMQVVANQGQGTLIAPNVYSQLTPFFIGIVRNTKPYLNSTSNITTTPYYTTNASMYPSSSGFGNPPNGNQNGEIITPGSTSSERQLSFIPDESNRGPRDSAPIQNNPNVQIITPYYFCYSYQILIDMINKHLNECYIELGPENCGNQGPPYLVLNQGQQLLSWIIPDGFIQANCMIYWNVELNNYLSGFHSYWTHDPTTNIGTHANYLLITATRNQNNYYDTIPDYLNYANPTPEQNIKLWYFSQEYTTLNYWNSLRKIVIATNLPIKNEYIPSFTPGGGQNDINANFPILTDFVPALEKGGDTRSIVYYVPTSQYRLVDMTDNNPIYDISLRLFWEDKFGNLYPIRITVYQQASVKLIFVKKSLYNGNMLLNK